MEPNNPANVHVFSDKANVGKLERALEEMNHLVVHDDTLQQQQLQFNKEWAELRRLIEQSNENWRLTNFHLVDQLHQRAHEITLLFQEALENNLMKDDEEQGIEQTGMLPTDLDGKSWADLCMAEETNNHSFPDHITSAALYDDLIEAPEPEQMNIDQNQSDGGASAAPTAIANTTVQAQIEKPIPKPNKPVTIVSDGQIATSSTAPVQEPPKIEHDERLEQLKQLPLHNWKPREFTLKSLLAYNRAILRLQTMPKLSKKPTQMESRALRDFITDFLKYINDVQIALVIIEPILMGNVIANFPPMVLTQFGILTRQGPTSIPALRDFLTSFEEYLLYGWVDDDLSPMEEATPAPKPNPQPLGPYTTLPLTYAQQVATGAIPENKPVSNQEKASGAKVSEDEWENEQTSSVSPWMRSSRFNKGEPQWPTVRQSRGKDKIYPSANPSKKSAGKPNAGGNFKCNVCLGCHGPHVLYKCPEFLSMTLEQRHELVERRKICPLCLVDFHKVIMCKKKTCEQCPLPHNSTLCEVSEYKRQFYQQDDQ